MSRNAAIWIRLLVPAVLLLAALTWLAWRERPRSTLVHRVTASAGAVLSAPVPRPTVAWRLHVSLDRPARGPGPVWVLHEGRQAGDGYELRYDPVRSSLLLARARQPVAVLLGAVALADPPTTVEITRRGLRLWVAVDGRRVLSCLDPLGAPPAQVWSWQAATAAGDVVVTLHDESRLMPAHERDLTSTDVELLRRVAADLGRADHAVAALRWVAALDPARGGQDYEAALRDAEVAATALPAGHPDTATVDAWLLWLRTRLAVSRSVDEPAGSADAVAGMRALARSGAAASELPGLMLELLATLVQRTCDQPGPGVQTREALLRRRAWFTQIAELGAAALAAMEARGHEVYGENVHRQLRLLVHGADCMRGLPPQPAPAEQQPWLTSRWLLLAGRDPLLAQDGAGAGLPLLPVGWLEQNPVAEPLQRLLAAAGADQLPAMVMRARVRDALERGDMAALERVLKAGPRHEAALTRALLALSGLGDGDAVRAAHDALAEAPQGGAQLRHRDPLAFALDRLLDLRRPPKLPNGGGAEIASRPPQQPAIVPGVSRLPGDILPNYERLLVGAPESVDAIWSVSPAALPPARALATALASQELAGVRADWSLVDLMPGATLPLHLLKPRERQPGEEPPAHDAGPVVP